MMLLAAVVLASAAHAFATDATALTAVPEPGLLAVLGGGVAGAILFARRRQHP
jgi:hypothetical protein